MISLYFYLLQFNFMILIPKQYEQPFMQSFILILIFNKLRNYSK